MKLIVAFILTCVTLLTGCATNTAVGACREAYFAQKTSLIQERDIAIAELHNLMNGDPVFSNPSAPLPSASTASLRTNRIEKLKYRIKNLNQQLAWNASSNARGSCDGINIYSRY